MARRSAATPADGRQPRPLFVVHLGDDSLRRLCELASGTVIAPGQLVPLLGEAEIERITYAGGSRRVVDLGRRSRFFTGPLRRAIQLRDRRCTEPGCDTPADDCDVDHLVPYASGGPTDQTNAALKCPHHNRHKGDTVEPPRAASRRRPMTAVGISEV
jgi:HNH endonuclease